jgi:hypothetical protein
MVVLLPDDKLHCWLFFKGKGRKAAEAEDFQRTSGIHSSTEAALADSFSKND